MFNIITFNFFADGTSVSGVTQNFRTVVDSITLIFNIDSQKGFFRNLFDNLNLNLVVDRLTNTGRLISNIFTLNFNIDRDYFGIRQVGDEITITDNTSKINGFFRIIADSINFIINSFRNLIGLRDISDTINITENTQRQTSFLRNFFDMITFNFFVNGTYTDIGVINTRNITDTLTFEDTMSRFRNLPRLIFDTINFEFVVDRLGIFWRNINQGINFIIRVIFPPSAVPVPGGPGGGGGGLTTCWRIVTQKTITIDGTEGVGSYLDYISLKISPRNKNYGKFLLIFIVSVLVFLPEIRKGAKKIKMKEKF